MERIAIGSGTERGKGDTGQLVLFCQDEAGLVGAGKQPRLIAMLSINWADSVEEIARLELNRCCCDGAACETAAQLAAHLHNAWAASAMNGPINAAAACKGRISSVDDGIRLDLNDIAAQQRQGHTVDSACRHKNFHILE